MNYSLLHAIESGSEHPLSKSICEYAIQKNNVQLVKVTNFENLPGMGVKATYNDKTYYCANHKLLKHSVDQNIVTKLQNEGKTITYIFDDEKVYGIIAIRDEIKEEVKDVIAYLDFKKITPVMLTGDNHNAAIAVAKDCGIKEVIADVMPDQKANKINELQQANRVVAMVGDGINDSVALVSADVGISIGSGTDIAIESSDIVLMKDNLKSLIIAINLSRKVVNNIKMNLFWAFFYNILFIPIAGGILYYPFNIILNPMLCALAMSLSSICVVLNALRIQNFKKEKK
ncbi:MAG: HAD-IC family P-type ATPase [Bacilli bacterium]